MNDALDKNAEGERPLAVGPRDQAAPPGTARVIVPTDPPVLTRDIATALLRLLVHVHRKRASERSGTTLKE